MSIICPVRDEGSLPPRSLASRAGGVGRGGQSEDLDTVSYHLQAALQAIRDKPVQGLAREEFYTWIYNLIGAALTLVVNDNKASTDANRRVIIKAPEPEAPMLAGDLDLIR